MAAQSFHDLQSKTDIDRLEFSIVVQANWGMFGKDGELLVSSSQLVHSVGFSPDKNILPNLSRIAEAGDGGKHFLVFGLPGIQLEPISNGPID